MERKKKEEAKESRKNRNHEIKVQGHWILKDLPFRPDNYFICYEDRGVEGKEKQNYTTLGIELNKSQKKSRKRMKEIIMEYQQSTRKEEDVDRSPNLKSFTSFESVLECHRDCIGHDVRVLKKNNQSESEINLKQKSKARRQQCQMCERILELISQKSIEEAFEFRVESQRILIKKMGEEKS